MDSLAGTFGLQICDYNGWWSDTEAAVACFQLGMPGPARAFGGAWFGYGPKRVWLEDVSCQGDEAGLEQCAHEPLGEYDDTICEVPTPIGVRCNAKPRKSNAPLQRDGMRAVRA